MIDTNNHIQVPALIHSILETFSRDGVSKTQLSDPEFMSYLNETLMSKNKPRFDVIPTNIGRGVGIVVERGIGGRDSNQDPFTLLVPDKSMI